MANRYRNNGIYLMLSDEELELLSKNTRNLSVNHSGNLF